jgi:hypothetical protein
MPPKRKATPDEDEELKIVGANNKPPPQLEKKRPKPLSNSASRCIPNIPSTQTN